MSISLPHLSFYSFSSYSSSFSQPSPQSLSVTNKIYGYSPVFPFILPLCSLRILFSLLLKLIKNPLYEKKLFFILVSSTLTCYNKVRVKERRRNPIVTEDMLRQYKVLVEFLGKALGPDYEVVLQTIGPEGSGIAAIEPNCVSGMIAARSLIGA